jgi:DNA polymerase V
VEGSVSGFYRQGRSTRLARPLIVFRVPAGFPSPAEDYVERRIDLNHDLIKHPDYTFYIQLEGDLMFPKIHPGSWLVIDRMEETREGDIVVARIGYDFTVKKLHTEENGQIWLMSENDAYPPIKIIDGMDFEVWGRVRWSFQRH